MAARCHWKTANEWKHLAPLALVASLVLGPPGCDGRTQDSHGTAGVSRTAALALEASEDNADDVGVEGSLTVTLPDPALEIARDGEGYALFQGKEIKFLSRAGEPSVPYLVLKVLLPPDAKLDTVKAELTGVQERAVEGAWDVRPAIAPSRPDGDVDALNTTVDGRDQAIYGQDAFFPARRIGSVGAGRLRLYKLATVPVCLARYNPSSKGLVQITGAQLTVKYQRSRSLLAQTDSALNAPDPIGAKRTKKLVLNYDEVAPLYSPAPAALAAAPPLPGYLIVTTQTIYNDATASIDALKAQIAGRGFNCEVRTESDWGGGTGDTGAENLRSYLQSQLVPWNLQYVLLIGNPDERTGDVPMKMTWPDGYFADPTTRLPVWEKGVPTDSYYAELTENWDYDGDGHYGEYTGDIASTGFTFDYDVAVGRIPFYSQAGELTALDSIVQKTNDYNTETPTNPSWRRNVLLPMQPMIDTIRPTRIAPNYDIGEIIKNEVLVPHSCPFHRVYDEDYDLLPSPETTNCTADTVRDAWKSLGPTEGFGAVFWLTHGLPTEAMDIMDLAHAADLYDDKPSFVFQGSCLNAHPETSDNLAYALLQNGAIATVGGTRVLNTNFQYYASSSALEPGSSPSLEYEFAQRLIAAGETGGDALHEAKEVPPTDSLYWWNIVALSLYGDPSASLGVAPPSGELDPYSRSYGYAAATGSANVYAAPGVSWTAVSNDSWITVTSGSTGSGDGVVAYAVAANTSGVDRVGTLSIGDTTYWVTQKRFNEAPGILNPGTKIGDTPALSWADFDNDGDLDVAVASGNDPKFAVNAVYKNEPAAGGGRAFSFVDKLETCINASLDWCDLNNDGYQDLVMSCEREWEDRVTKVYRNDPDGGGRTFTEVPAGIRAGVNGATDCGDYDNDGDVDILFAGYHYDGSSTQKFTRIYRNDDTGSSSSWVFSEIDAGLEQVRDAKLAWGDYDNDGDLDILLTGTLVYGVGVAKIYRNDAAVGGGRAFTDISAGLVAVVPSAAEWVDFDNDGDLDVFVSGVLDTLPWQADTIIYRNDPVAGGRSFTNISAGLPKYNVNAAWGDYDNDGDQDLLVARLDRSTDPPRNANILYRNDSGALSQVDPGVSISGKIAWGDYDNDGRLDLITAGASSYNYKTALKIYHNDDLYANTVPVAPTSAGAVVSGDAATMYWNDGADAQTPTPGLSYNLYLGTTRRGPEEVSPNSDAATGYRRIVHLGNANENLGWTVNGLPGGMYYWSVQSIDTAFAGSLFASERTFTIDPTISGAVTNSGAGMAGVEMRGLPTPVVTDAAGYYTVTVPYGWSGAVQPYAAGYSFTPGGRNYSTVVWDAANQDYAAGQAALRAQYFSYHREPVTNTLYVNIRVYNDGPNPLNIEDISTRYWYQSELSYAEKAEIDEARKMPSGRDLRSYARARLDTLSPEVGGQDRVQVAWFAAGAGAIRTGEFVEVHLRIHYTNWQNYTQTNDYSFGTQSWFINWPKVVVYHKLSQVAGIPPCDSEYMAAELGGWRRGLPTAAVFGRRCLRAASQRPTGPSGCPWTGRSERDGASARLGRLRRERSAADGSASDGTRALLRRWGEASLELLREGTLHVGEQRLRAKPRCG